MADMDRFTPWYTALDHNPPGPNDEALSVSLREYMDSVAPLETSEEQNTRISLLEELRDMLNDWVLRKLEEKHVIFEGEENELAGKVFVSGSYRLGVNTRGSDIDTICTIPTPLSREEFFSEESGMVALLRKHSEVTYVNPITGARVPIIEVVWNDIELDVLCAIIQKPRVPQRPQELLDDSILVGMDEASQITLNGPRVTELMIRLVPDQENYKLVLRCVRYWAKRRGLYSNKIGFLGGVNWAILAAFVCQLYPMAKPALLLRWFFHLYLVWKWPTEVRLCHPYEVEGLEEKQWEPRPMEVMPIITPAYPCMNSSFTVSRYTLRIMTREFFRGEEICKRVIAEAGGKDTWAPLFSPCDFFVRYSTYLVVKAECPTDDMLNRWSGWVEARIRRLLDELDNFSMDDIYPFPKKFSHDGVELPFEAKANKPKEEEEEEENKAEESKDKDKAEDKAEEDKSKDTEKSETGADGDAAMTEAKAQAEPSNKASGEEGTAKSSFTCYWYLGVRPHPINSVRKSHNIDISRAVAQWTLSIKSWPERTDGMDVDVMMAKWSQLPDDPELFPDGKAAVRDRHKAVMREVKRQNDRLREENGMEVVRKTPKKKKKKEGEEEAAAAAEAAGGKVKVERKAGEDQPSKVAKKEEGADAATDAEASDAATTATATVKDEPGTKAEREQAKTEIAPTEAIKAAAAEEAGSELERMQNLLSKRAREDLEATQASKKAREVHGSDFFKLPRVKGISTVKPIHVFKRDV